MTYICVDDLHIYILTLMTYIYIHTYSDDPASMVSVHRNLGCSSNFLRGQDVELESKAEIQ